MAGAKVTEDMKGPKGARGPMGPDGVHKKPRNAVARMTRHRQIMVMLLKGVAVKDIARELGYAAASISILIRTAGFQLELAKLRDIVLVHVEDELSKMGRLTPLAHGFYEKVLRDDNNVFSSDLKYKVSKDLFDRLGVKVAEGERLNPGEVGDVAEMVQVAFDKAKVIEVEGVAVADVGSSTNGDSQGDSQSTEGLEREGKQVSGEQITKELQELLADAEQGGRYQGERGPEGPEGLVDLEGLKESEDEILQEVAQV